MKTRCVRIIQVKYVILIFFLFIQISCNSGGNPTKLEVEDLSSYFKEPKVPFSPRQYVCYKSDQLISIDGVIDEAIWQHAEWTQNFVDIEGDLKQKPRFRTRVKMLWDDQYFYTAVEMEEPDIWATLKKRDSVIYHDNDFEVFIDPDGDTHQYYELEINAYGTEWDLFLSQPYRDGGGALNFWHINGLKSKVSMNGTINNPGDRDKSWFLEIAIPWDVLKECANKSAPPLAGDQWRINFSRVEWQVEVKNGGYVKLKDPKTDVPLPENNWVWSPQGLINMHYPEMWGFVQFSKKTAGSGKDTFEFKNSENIKWALRQVYYRERMYFNKYGKYTDKLADLGLDHLFGEKYEYSPEIYCTLNFFEAVLSSNNEEKTWHISQNGRVW